MTDDKNGDIQGVFMPIGTEELIISEAYVPLLAYRLIDGGAALPEDVRAEIGSYLAKYHQPGGAATDADVNDIVIRAIQDDRIRIAAFDKDGSRSLELHVVRDGGGHFNLGALPDLA